MPARAHRTVPKKLRSKKRLELVRIRIQDRSAPRSPRAIDQRVELAELIVQRTKQLIDGFLARDVGHNPADLRPPRR